MKPAVLANGLLAFAPSAFSQKFCHWLVCAGFLLSMGCGKQEEAVKPISSTRDGPQPSSTPPPPEWAKKSPKDWPQIVLTNDAKFKGHTGLQGASAFLLEGPQGNVLMATARHLIGDAGGVEPPIPVKELDGVLVSWKVHPRTEPEKAVEAGKLAASGFDRRGADWLVLSLKKSGDPLPATPLKLRPTPVKVGEKVFLIGCPYGEAKCKQNVYEGKVTKRDFENRFQYTLQPPVNLRGFSGAPIVDGNGYLVGMMTVWFDRILSDGKDTLGGGEDAALLIDLLKRR